MNLKTFIAGVLGLLLAFSNASAGGDGATASKHMVVMLTEASVVKAGFGLAVANAMQDAGVKSTVFISADAVDFVYKKGTQPTFAGSTPRALIQALIGKGGKVMICEGFVKLRGIKPSDMLEGVRVAAPADLAGALFAPDTQALTF